MTPFALPIQSPTWLSNAENSLLVIFTFDSSMSTTPRDSKGTSALTSEQHPDYLDRNAFFIITPLDLPNHTPAAPAAPACVRAACTLCAENHDLSAAGRRFVLKDGAQPGTQHIDEKHWSV
jgi:hypothetical protein